MSGLVNLLKDLGSDAALEQRYIDDRDAVMQQYGLTDEEKDALRTANVGRLRTLSGLDDIGPTHSTVKYSG